MACRIVRRPSQLISRGYVILRLRCAADRTASVQVRRVQAFSLMLWGWFREQVGRCAVRMSQTEEDSALGEERASKVEGV